MVIASRPAARLNGSGHVSRRAAERADALVSTGGGGLHLYFYVLRLQGDERRYDARPFARKNRAFTFRSTNYGPTIESKE